MKPGPIDQYAGTNIMRNLRAAIDTSTDARLKHELQHLHDQIRVLAFTRN
jgi:hypothetical protein